MSQYLHFLVKFNYYDAYMHFILAKLSEYFVENALGVTDKKDANAVILFCQQFCYLL